MIWYKRSRTHCLLTFLGARLPLPNMVLQVYDRPALINSDMALSFLSAGSALRAVNLQDPWKLVNPQLEIYEVSTCKSEVLAKTNAASREFILGSGNVLTPPQVRKNTAQHASAHTCLTAKIGTLVRMGRPKYQNEADDGLLGC